MGAPLAIFSIGITAYLVNKLKDHSVLLDSSLPPAPPATESSEAPEEAESVPDENSESSVSDKENADKQQGTDPSNEGNEGVKETTEEKEDPEHSTGEDNPPPQAAAPESSVPTADDSKKVEPKVKDANANEGVSGGDTSSSEVMNRVTLESEIKKMVSKVVKEKNSWLSKPNSLKNTFEMHELLDVGTKLLEKLSRGTAEGTKVLPDTN